MLERKYGTHKQYIYILDPDEVVRKVTLAFYIYCSKNLPKLFTSLHAFISTWMSEAKANTHLPITFFTFSYCLIYNNNLILSFYLHILLPVSSVRHGGVKTPTQNIKLVPPIRWSSKTTHAYQETWVTEWIKSNELLLVRTARLTPC